MRWPSGAQATVCGHPNRKHKALGKCSVCYQEHFRRIHGQRPRGSRVPDCHPGNPHKAHGECVTCYTKNRHKPLSYRVWKNKILREYGLTEEAYEEKLLAQDGACAICRGEEITRKLSVDHIHGTTQARGLLCGNCNRALGLVKENPETLLAMIDYLRKWEQ